MREDFINELKLEYKFKCTPYSIPNLNVLQHTKGKRTMINWYTQKNKEAKKKKLKEMKILSPEK